MEKFRKYGAGLYVAVVLLLALASTAQAGGINNVYKVLVGGMPFGVKFYTDGIVIVGFSEGEAPAFEAGLRINDIITHVNGEAVSTSEELVKTIESSVSDIEITYRRGGSVGTLMLSPREDEDGKMKTGMWVRDTTAGIGTVTYIIPETGEFAGLGHGICDSETGELYKMDRGQVVAVEISGVTRGISGSPGELKGFFTAEKTGVLIKNTLCGVSGLFSRVPASLSPETLELGERNDVCEGEAYIWCTVEGQSPRKYTIEISEINYDSRDNRSFSVTVTDPELLMKTGGIVQGMSGSPIVQNGKLIGAVTHVLVGNPSKGYGIFIENMLEAVA